MKNDKPIDLRDQFAIAAMKAIIESSCSGTAAVCTSFILDQTDKISDIQLLKMERVAIVAYKMADAMRKVRLKAFD